MLCPPSHAADRPLEQVERAVHGVRLGQRDQRAAPNARASSRRTDPSNAAAVRRGVVDQHRAAEFDEALSP